MSYTVPAYWAVFVRKLVECGPSATLVTAMSGWTVRRRAIKEFAQLRGHYTTASAQKQPMDLRRYRLKALEPPDGLHTVPLPAENWGDEDCEDCCCDKRPHCTVTVPPGVTVRCAYGVHMTSNMTKFGLI